jgi:ketosteroid isomerase-like protein
MTDIKAIATTYIEAVGTKDFSAVEASIASNFVFKGPSMKSDSAAAFTAGLHRFAPLLERNDVKHVFVVGDRVCVVYDFVTNTASGAIPTVELLTIRDDKIAEVEIFFDVAQFAIARDEMLKRKSG